MIQTCQNCTYHMIGDPPVCNALHTPIAGDIDCADWKTNETQPVKLTEVFRQRSEQVERWREAFERGDPFGDLPEITHDPRGNLRIDRSEAMMFGYEIQESIEARRAAIARDVQRRADEAIAPIAFTFRVDRDRDSYAFVNCVFENGREVARDLQRQADEAIALSELQAICDRDPNPIGEGQKFYALRQSTGRLIEFIAIATPNGLKWQYQGAVIID